MRKPICLVLLFLISFGTLITFAEEGVSPLDMFVRQTSLMKRKVVDDMHSFFLKCERLRCEDVLRSRYSGGDIPLSWELGWKGKNFYAKRTFVPTAVQRKMEDILIPEEPTISILKDGAFMEWSTGLEKCNVDIYEGYTMVNLINEWAFFEFLGYNIAEKIINSSKNTYKDVYEKMENDPAFYFLRLPYLPESIVNNYSMYAVNREKEKIDDSDCFVLEWRDKDVLWVDPNHHWVVRQRTTFTDDKHKKFTVRYQDYREIEPGVWFPFKLSVDVYADTKIEPKANWDKIAKRWQFEVTELKTEFPEVLLAVSPPPGTLVVDGIRGTTYTIYDPVHDPFAGPIEQGLKANRYVVFRAICIVIGSILIFIAVWRMLRRMEVK